MSFKNKIVVAIMLHSNYMLACDFCGCYMGITPYDNQSGMSVLYRYKSFSGYPDQGHKNYIFPSSRSYSSSSNNSFTSVNNSYSGYKHGTHTTVLGGDTMKFQRDYEIFTTAELRAKYFIHKRIELNGVVPFVMNSARQNEVKQKINGVGDITLFAAYHLISRIMTEKYQHRLIFGAGVKLPVGDYYQKDADGNRIDFLLQPGTGSVDYLAYVNYIFGYKKFGFNLNSTYKINGDNFYKERIGNSSTNYLNIFYKFRQEKDLKLFPSIQTYYEHTEGLYVFDKLQKATKMEVFNAGIGLDVFYKNIALNMSFQLPVYEKRFESNLQNTSKMMIGLTYNFNQKKYLIKSKTQE
ncbi:MAG: hypothetical protein JNL69_12245 [Bacteroidia bacterium]|nr:hypothetical protein [Bacteroidia bacterium]